MRSFFVIIAFALITGCSEPMAELPSVSAEETSFSGTYYLKGIECYNKYSSAKTDGALIETTDSITLQGTTFTGRTENPGCVVENSGTLQFNPNSTANYKGSVISATNGSCVSTVSISDFIPNNITPKISQSTVTTGDTWDKKTLWTRRSDYSAFGILSIFKTTNTEDYCFVIYMR